MRPFFSARARCRPASPGLLSVASARDSALHACPPATTSTACDQPTRNYIACGDIACAYATYGCTDSTALNYDALATHDDPADPCRHCQVNKSTGMTQRC